jgi:hypothetical protein
MTLWGARTTSLALACGFRSAVSFLPLALLIAVGARTGSTGASRDKASGSA